MTKILLLTFSSLLLFSLFFFSSLFPEKWIVEDGNCPVIGVQRASAGSEVLSSSSLFFFSSSLSSPSHLNFLLLFSLSKLECKKGVFFVQRKEGVMVLKVFILFLSLFLSSPLSLFSLSFLFFLFSSPFSFSFSHFFQRSFSPFTEVLASMIATYIGLRTPLVRILSEQLSTQIPDPKVLFFLFVFLFLFLVFFSIRFKILFSNNKEE